MEVFMTAGSPTTAIFSAYNGSYLEKRLISKDEESGPCKMMHFAEVPFITC